MTTPGSSMSERAVLLGVTLTVARHTAAGTLGVMGTTTAPRFVDSFIGGCHTVPSPQMVIPEYGSSPEIAGTPAPGSASMSSLGLRPSLDRRLRCGRSAPSV